MKASPRICQRAFTLIEIMMVVAIIGLIAGLSISPLIKALQKEGMRKALGDVEDVCFSARQQAIFSRQKTAVLFKPQTGEFSVEGGGGGPRNGKVTSSRLPDGISFAMLDIFHKDYAESEWARVFFYPDGTSDEAVIVLLGKGERKQITLDYVTGMPIVSEVGQ